MVSPDIHVGITNRLDLVDVVFLSDRVKRRVQTVQHVDNLLQQKHLVKLTSF